MRKDAIAPPNGRAEGPSMIAAGAPITSATPSGLPVVVIERPPPGLLRGKVGAPATLIAVLGALALCVSLAFYLRKSTLARASRKQSS